MRAHPEARLSTNDPSDRSSQLPASAAIDGAALLRLAGAQDERALARLRQYTPEQIAGALAELEPARRVEFLETAERLGEIVPLLPEAGFPGTLRAAGLEESGWLLGFASPEQRIASVDLDCWRDDRLSPSRLFEWLDAMIEAGPETLVAAFDELDPELWVLALRSMAEFSVPDGGDDEAPGGSTIDGVVFYAAHGADDEERLYEVLSTALHHAPHHYWRLVYAAIFESEAECEAFAARWQRGRLADLGFPARERALRVYAPLAVEDAPLLEVAKGVTAAVGRLPETAGGGLFGRAIEGLPAERARERTNEVLALANALAVADGLPLAAPETAGRSFAKAMRGVERGLAELARSRGQDPGAVLEATRPHDLFRVGATLDPELRPGLPVAPDERPADWGVDAQEISAADRTLRGDGSPNERG
jgi:hypothetical protein